MNIENARMQVDYWQARTEYLRYRDLVKSGKGVAGDNELRAAYRAISRGEFVIDINLAIAGGGVNEQGLPKLAITRADWPFVHVWRREGYFVFSRQSEKWGRAGVQQFTHNVKVRMPLPPSVPTQAAGRAQVPSIPPAHRPKGDVSSYRILFEAVWQRVPPVDPILLKHLEGPFYVVLAQWDLSDLERAVLRARL